MRSGGWIALALVLALLGCEDRGVQLEADLVFAKHQWPWIVTVRNSGSRSSGPVRVEFPEPLSIRIVDQDGKQGELQLARREVALGDFGAGQEATVSAWGATGVPPNYVKRVRVWHFAKPIEVRIVEKEVEK
jgi:hypothetical protein